MYARDKISVRLDYVCVMADLHRINVVILFNLMAIQTNGKQRMTKLVYKRKRVLFCRLLVWPKLKKNICFSHKNLHFHSIRILKRYKIALYSEEAKKNPKVLTKKPSRLEMQAMKEAQRSRYCEVEEEIFFLKNLKILLQDKV